MVAAVRLFSEEPSNSAWTVKFLVGEYLKSCKQRELVGTLSHGHTENLRGSLENFVAFAGEKLVTDCRQYDLTEWLRSNKAWKSAHTKRRGIAAVLSAFRWAEDEDYIDRCPYRRPSILRDDDAKPRRPATEQEYRTLFAEGSKPLKHALFMLKFSGCRTCELREMMWSDVHFGDSPHIRLEKHKTRKKTGKARIIPLSPVVAKFLAYLARTPSRSGHVFTNCDGGAWIGNSFAHHLRRQAKRSGLDDGSGSRVTAYCLRHTYCCDAIRAGFTAKQVADLMGHSDTKMVTSIYGGHTAEDLAYLADLARRKG